MTDTNHDGWRTPRQCREDRRKAERQANTADAMSRTVYEALRRVAIHSPDEDIEDRAEELFDRTVELSRELGDFHDEVTEAMEGRKTDPPFESPEAGEDDG